MSEKRIFDQKTTVTTYSIPAPVKRPVRFAVVSDFHDGSVSPLVGTLERLSFDFLVLPGDVIHDPGHTENGLRLLSACADRWPTYVSLGNHEMYCGRDIVPVIRQTGATLLDNESVSLDGLTIGGLSSRLPEEGPEAGEAFLHAFAQSSGYKMLLCHQPELFPKLIRPLPIRLTVSGHAHGGQWRVFGHGVYAPGQGLWPRYTCGLYEDRLLVSRGLGNPIPIPRLFNPPELLLVTLLPEK